MMFTEREEKILKILQSTPSISVKALTKALYTSEATVRRDLTKLESKGLIIRAHGKAINAELYADKNQGFALRENTASPVKKKLAEKAVSLCVNDGNVILLDASSTVLHLIEPLKEKKDIIVITSGLKTAVSLSNTNIKFYSTGGQAINGSSSFVGQTAIDTLKHFKADVSFVSCHGLSEDGYPTDTSERENDVRYTIIKQSKRKVLLLDSSKINKNYWHILCHISEFDDVFCNEPLPEHIQKQVKNFHLVSI